MPVLAWVMDLGMKASLNLSLDESRELARSCSIWELVALAKGVYRDDMDSQGGGVSTPGRGPTNCPVYARGLLQGVDKQLYNMPRGGDNNGKSLSLSAALITSLTSLTTSLTTT